MFEYLITIYLGVITFWYFAWFVNVCLVGMKYKITDTHCLFVYKKKWVKVTIGIEIK